MCARQASRQLLRHLGREGLGLGAGGRRPLHLTALLSRQASCEFSGVLGSRDASLWRRHFAAQAGQETEEPPKEKSAEEAPETPPEASPSEGATASTEKGSVSVAEKDLQDLQEKVRAKKNELLLALADNENNKKKFAKEREARRRAATQGFARRMVDVFQELDSFATPAHGGASKGLYEGVSLTRDLFRSALGKHGVQPFEPEQGLPFMRDHHESVGTVADSNLSTGAVAEVVRPGWLFDSGAAAPAVLQKAQVKLAKHGPEVPADTA